MNKAIETLIKRHRFSPEDKKLLMNIDNDIEDITKNGIQIKVLDYNSIRTNQIEILDIINNFPDKYIIFIKKDNSYSPAWILKSRYIYFIDRFNLYRITLNPDGTFVKITNIDLFKIQQLLNPHIIEDNAEINEDYLTTDDYGNIVFDVENPAIYRVYDLQYSGMVLTPYSITSSEIRCKLPEGEIIVRISNGKYIIISDFGEVE